MKTDDFLLITFANYFTEKVKFDPKVSNLHWKQLRQAQNVELKNDVGKNMNKLKQKNLFI